MTHEFDRDPDSQMDPSTFAQYGPWECPLCGHDSTRCYRCTACGYDFVED